MFNEHLEIEINVNDHESEATTAMMSENNCCVIFLYKYLFFSVFLYVTSCYTNPDYA